MFEKCSRLPDKLSTCPSQHNSVFVTIYSHLLLCQQLYFKQHFPHSPWYHREQPLCLTPVGLFRPSCYTKLSSLLLPGFDQHTWCLLKYWSKMGCPDVLVFLGCVLWNIQGKSRGLRFPACLAVGWLLCLLYRITWCYQDLGTVLMCSKAEIQVSSKDFSCGNLDAFWNMSSCMLIVK